MRKTVALAVLWILIIQVSWSQRDFSDSEITKVVLLGTGNPNPSPSQSGCSVAIIVNDTPYIIDFGPGLVRKAAEMSPAYGGKIKGLDVKNLKHAFLTHLHSDHTIGYPDLILTPWVMGRNEPLEVYGPEGTEKLTSGILEAYDADIKYRIYGDEPGNDTGWRVNCHEFSKDGVIYQDGNVKVEAFKVEHGTWPNAFGFRITTPDKKIVISGDTRPSRKVAEYSRDADILIHEVYSDKGFQQRNDDWKKYHSEHHTSTKELGEIASEAKPKLIVLYHILFWGSPEEELLAEIGEKYKGKVISGRDLDIF